MLAALAVEVTATAKAKIRDFKVVLNVNSVEGEYYVLQNNYY